MSNPTPLVLVDLDDNLFQTTRKMTEAPINIATLNIDGKPSGYMTLMQKAFVEWLLASADVVPVTARSIEAFSRVQLPFSGIAICSHGGVILTPKREIDRDWHVKITEQLAPYQGRLAEISALTLEAGSRLGHSLRGWVVEEAGSQFYVVTKHNDQQDECLLEVLTEVRAQGLIDDLYVHVNGNNLAFMPRELNKRFAVRELIERDLAMHGPRPVLGFGDSLSDLGFMAECQFWGTPEQSQISKFLMDKIDD